jgi:hypothetical protein
MSWKAERTMSIVLAKHLIGVTQHPSTIIVRVVVHAGRAAWTVQRYRRVHTRALCLPSRGGGHGATRVGRVRDKIRYDAENLFNWWSPCRVPTNGHNLCSTARRRARISPWLRSVSMESEGTGGILICVPFFFSPQTVITRLDAAQVYLCRGALLRRIHQK